MTRLILLLAVCLTANSLAHAQLEGFVLHGPLAPPTPVTTISDTSPENGEGGVALTRETIIHFSAPLEENPSASFFRAVAGGTVLPTRLHVSRDRMKATIFYLSTLPESARVQIEIVGDHILDHEGRPIDGDGDGTPGGTASFTFNTLSLSSVPGTIVCGRVFASELQNNAQGTTSSLNLPLKGVRITVDGREDELFAVTDEMGNFRLENTPAGEFFVHIDGRTVSEALINETLTPTSFPEGPYYPFVGKSWKAVAGRETNIGNIFLPLVRKDTLKEVSMTEETMIEFLPEVLAEFPEFAGTQLMVPPDSLFSDNGLRGGRVGIAPVPPDRLPGELPPDLNFPLVITVQTDGPTNFDGEVPICFPNLPDPETGETLPPGAKSALWSFNHDTGRFEIVGPMTVSQDGSQVCSDRGVGVPAPGWHGNAAGGSGSGGGTGNPDGDGDDDPDDPDPTPGPGGLGKCNDEINGIGSAFVQCHAATGLALIETVPAVGCAVSFGFGIAASVVDCNISFSGCGRTIATNFVGSAIGCIPVIGGVAGAAFTCGTGLGFSLDDYQDCVTSRIAKGGLPPTIEGQLLQAEELLEKQILLWSAAADVYTEITGDGIWVNFDFAEAKEMVSPFLVAIEAALDPASPGGETVTATEKSDLMAMELPPIVTPAQQEALIDRLENMVAGNFEAINLDLDKLEVEAMELMNLASQLESEGWATTYDGILRAFDIIAKNMDFFTEAGAVNTRFTAVNTRSVVEAPFYYKLKNLRTDRVRRGQLGPQGLFSNLFLQPDDFYSVQYLHPGTLEIAATFFQAPAAGGEVELPRAPLATIPSPDTDGDLLPDLAEEIVGTSITDSDTDDDGIGDGAEIQNGTNPLDGLPVVTGLLATVDSARDRVEIAAADDIALLAGESTISIFNIFNGMEPVLVSEIRTPGIAVDAAFSGDQIIVVDGGAGVTFIDFSNPITPEILETVDVDAEALAVTAQGDYAQIRVTGDFNSSRVFVMDIAARTKLPTSEVFFNDRVEHMSLAEDILVVLTRFSLKTYRVLGPSLTLLDSVNHGVALSSSSGSGIFNAGDLIYLAHSIGYDTYDISDPTNITRVGQAAAAFGVYHGVAANGSGSVIATYSGGLSGWPISLFDGSDPTNTDAIIEEFPVPGETTDLTIYNGLSYSASGPAGMNVVNYLSYDSQGVPPTISLKASFLTARSNIEENVPTFVSAVAEDDGQVRNVEFYMNVEKVFVDGNFPFTFYFTTPSRDEMTSFTLRARASDTGGNFVWSEEVSVLVDPDTTPPSVIGKTPENNSTSPFETVEVVGAFFDEIIDPASLSASSFRLTEAGMDGTHGTVDDVTIPGTRDFVATQRLARFVVDSPLTDGNYRAVVTTEIADPSGNHLASEFAWEFTVTGAIFWTGDGDGTSWDDPNNWDLDQVPGVDAVAIIDEISDVPITVMDTYSLERVRSERPLHIQSFGFNLDSASEFNNGGIIASNILRVFEKLTLDGAFEWTNGQIQENGKLEITPSGQLTISQSSSANLSLSQVDNHGEIIWTGGNIALGPGAFFINHQGGIVRCQAPTAVLNEVTATVRNQGLFINQLGASTTINTIFHNEGDVQVETGVLTVDRIGGSNSVSNRHTGQFLVDNLAELRFEDSGEQLLDLGVQFTGNGPVVLEGNLNLQTDVTIPNFSMCGNADGFITGLANLTILNEFNWCRGSMKQTGITQITAGATIRLMGPRTKFLHEGTLQNFGVVEWTDGDFQDANNATVINEESGVIRLSADDGNFTLEGAPGQLINHGLIETLDNQNHGFTLAILNEGTVDLGIGQLFCQGGYFQAGDAATELRIDGTSAFGKLVVSNNTIEEAEASLDGTLRIETGQSYSPNVGDKFLILNSEIRSGQFAVFDAPPISSDRAFELNYTGNRAEIEVVPVP